MTDCGFHEAAFDPAASKPELLCKLAWTLFGEGKTDQIIANLMGEGAVFELFADLPEGTAVPYAGSFTEGWERPFGARRTAEPPATTRPPRLSTRPRLSVLSAPRFASPFRRHVLLLEDRRHLPLRAYQL